MIRLPAVPWAAEVRTRIDTRWESSMLSQWLLVPVVAAAIGWVTNFIAVRMIFRPHRPIRFLGLTIQGLLPKRRHEFAESIGRTVEEHLVSAEDIKKVLADPAVKEKLAGTLRSRIDSFIQDKIVAKNPMLGMFLKGPFVDGLKDGLVTEFHGMFESGVAELGTHLDENLDLRRIVVEKVAGFDMKKLEDIVLEVARRELFWIEILGAILGFVVGLVQLLLLGALGN